MAFLAAWALPPCSNAAEAAEEIRGLLVAWDDATPAHNWPEVSQAIKETLASTRRFELRVCEDGGVLDSATSLARYDLFFL